MCSSDDGIATVAFPVDAIADDAVRMRSVEWHLLSCLSSDEHPNCGTH